MKLPETPTIQLEITPKGVGNATLTGDRLACGFLFQLLSSEINRFDLEVRALIRQEMELGYKSPLKEKKEFK